MITLNTPRLARRLAGARSQSNGALFESLFEVACKRSRIATTRFPDGCRQVGPKRLIRVKTPWDWILTLERRSAFIDTKRTEGSSFPHSKIEPHQVLPMLEHENHGSKAGYVIHTVENDRVFFAPASLLVGLLDKRGSLAWDDFLEATQYLGSGAQFDPKKIF